MLRGFGALLAIVALAGCQAMRADGPSPPAAYAATAGGSVGIVGSRIAVGIDAGDRNIGLNAEYRALEFGDPGVALDWAGHGGVAGVVVPGTRYRINDTDCRELTETLNQHDTTETASATACRGADGVWRVVD